MKKCMFNISLGSVTPEETVEGPAAQKGKI